MNSERQNVGAYRAAKAAGRLCALAAALLLAASPAFSAVRSSGTYEISDDLAAGFAGSAGLAGAGVTLDGSLGQVAVSTAGGGGTDVENGYFSMMPSIPAAVTSGQVFTSSAQISASATANPSGTVYFVETATSTDFAGTVITGANAFWPDQLTGLRGNTTYYTRLRASYLGEDWTGYTPNAAFQTLPATPTPQGFAAVHSSSLTVAWDDTANAAGTRYYVQFGGEPGFLTGGFANTTGSGYTFTGLAPNTTYFVRIKAIGDFNDETPFALFGSTITAAVTPATTAPCAVSSVTLTAYWGANGNPAGTRYLVQYSTDGFVSVQGSSLTAAVSAAFSGLTPNTTHFLRVSALNNAGTAGQAAQLPDAMTAAAPPLQQAVTFPGRAGFSINLQWLANSNPPNTEYLAEASTSSNFTGAFTAGPGWSPGVAVTAAGLEPVTLYYFRAKARNAAGAESAWTSLGSTATLTGVDLTSPTITNNQAGDATWRSSNTATYNVDLADSGGSYLSKLQVRVTTGAAGTGTLVFDWSDAVTNINANFYTVNWGLTQAQWDLLQAGTNYVSVRAYDGAGWYDEKTDAFYVLKDTVAPTITDLQPGENAWRKTDPGAIYLVNFNDADGGAGLAAVEYSASNAPGGANANVLTWTALPGLTPGATYYDGPWAVNFGALASGVTNYISVRARDGAGSITQRNDVFNVLKNTSGPEVRLTSPFAGFHSALAAVSGTAAQVLEYAITGTELTLQDKGSNLYWSDTGFISASPVWLKATGLNSWTYAVSTVTWIAGTQYQVVARTADTALNYSQPYATGTFTFDNSVPTAFVSTPAANATVETPALIAGTAADAGPNSGVPYVGVRIRRAVDLKWWDFATGAWTTSAISTLTTGGAAWAFYPDGALRGNLQNGVTYYAYAAPRDGAIPPNEPSYTLYAATFTVRDTVAPGAIAVSSAAQGALPGRLAVTWLAPGDDGALGTLADNCWFAIQYSTWSGAAFSTTAAAGQVMVSTSGVAPGSTQYHLLSGLTPGVTYFVKIWTEDEGGNWSGPSAMASGRAAPSLADSIAGNVFTAAGAGVTGVLVEAIDRNLAVVKSVYTVDDGSGSFTLPGLGEGLYRVQATWLSDGFASSVASDQIPTGYAEVRFTLSVAFDLASVGGELPLPHIAVSGRRASAGAAYSVELYQNSRLVAVAPVGAGGRFLISNLLPGKYSLKIPDGSGGSKLLQVSLAPGQALLLRPLGELLKAAEVYAYPNPARRTVTFRVKSERAPVQKQVAVFDLTGRPVKEFGDGDFTAVSATVSEVTWHIPSGVASGVYIYTTRVKETASGDSEKVTKKFAIVR